MRLPRLPRLPVSRRRHDELAELVCAYNRIASEDLAEYKRRARKAEARVAELKQAIRGHLTTNAGHARLRAVLDGHDRQEADPLPGCQTCNDTGTFELGGHEYWCKSCRGIPDPPPAEPVTYQDGRRYRLVQDGERSFRAVEADVRQPRSGRWSRRQRARDWLTGGSFRGVRRER